MSSRRESNGRRNRRRNADIPVSAFADVAFLLIIFFLVATSLTRTAGFKTDLPAARKSEKKDESKRDVILHDGRILLNEKPVSLDALRRRLEEMKLPGKSNKDRTIRLEVRGRDDWGVYFQVMAVIKETGGIIGIVMEDDAREGRP